MDFALLLPAIYNFLTNVPVVGPALAVITGIVFLLPGLLTALVALWHGVVLTLKALGKVPGLGFLAGAAEFFSTNEPRFQALATKVIDWIALLPLPKKPEAIAAEKAKE